jgi:hypothetical protein
VFAAGLVGIRAFGKLAFNVFAAYLAANKSLEETDEWPG